MLILACFLDSSSLSATLLGWAGNLCWSWGFYGVQRFKFLSDALCLEFALSAVSNSTCNAQTLLQDEHQTFEASVRKKDIFLKTVDFDLIWRWTTNIMSVLKSNKWPVWLQLCIFYNGCSEHFGKFGFAGIKIAEILLVELFKNPAQFLKLFYQVTKQLCQVNCEEEPGQKQMPDQEGRACTDSAAQYFASLKSQPVQVCIPK